MRWLACLAAFFMLPALSEAAVVTYSWSGNVTLVGSSDPWGLGAGPTPYSLMVNIDSNAVDSNSAINRATFTVLSAGLTIGGQPYVVGSGRSVILTDNASPFNNDQILVSFLSVTSPSNITVPLPFFVNLPTSTFSFSASLETPPVFGTVLSSAATTNFVGEDYRTGVTTDTAVTAIATPEPASLTLWGLGALGGAVAARRRKRD
jgi:MYXO-CTERM domain-containing protein